MANGVDFIIQKFDEYEKDRGEQDAIVATCQSRLKITSTKVENLNLLWIEFALKRWWLQLKWKEKLGCIFFIV